jgi:hypothetical protein
LEAGVGLVVPEREQEVSMTNTHGGPFYFDEMMKNVGIEFFRF